MKHTATLAVTRDPDLTPLQRVLALSDGSMTSLIEALTGEVLRIRTVEQRIVRDGPHYLQIPQGGKVLKRLVLLCGKHLTHGLGDSLILLDRLPLKIQDALVEGAEPIGRLWMRNRIETYRELLACGKEQGGLLAKHFGLMPTAELLFRTSLVHYRGKPLALITERFPLHFGAHPALRTA